MGSGAQAFGVELLNGDRPIRYQSANVIPARMFSGYSKSGAPGRKDQSRPTILWRQFSV
jgi:hypothetical protein